jgi:hypothetical protein
MKKRIRSVLAAFVCVGLILALSPLLFPDTGYKWRAVRGPRHSYFATRQWMADVRTIVAAVRYLYESRNYIRTNLTEVVNLPTLAPVEPISTNFIGRAAPVMEGA